MWTSATECGWPTAPAPAISNPWPWKTPHPGRGGASPLTRCSSSSARSRGRNGSARVSHVTSGGSSSPDQTCRATPPPTGTPAERRCCWRRACPGYSRPVMCAGDQSRGSRPRWRGCGHRPPDPSLPGNHNGSGTFGMSCPGTPSQTVFSKSQRGAWAYDPGGWPGGRRLS